MVLYHFLDSSTTDGTILLCYLGFCRLESVVYISYIISSLGLIHFNISRISYIQHVVMFIIILIVIEIMCLIFYNMSSTRTTTTMCCVRCRLGDIHLLLVTDHAMRYISPYHITDLIIGHEQIAETKSYLWISCTVIFRPDRPRVYIGQPYFFDGAL